MTANQALQGIPFWQIHPDLTSLIIVGIVTVLLVILFLIQGVYGLELVIIFISGMALFVIVDVIMSAACDIHGLNQSRINRLLETPVEQTKVTKTELVGASSEGFARTDIHGNLFYIAGSTQDTTSYRYVTKSTNGYQVMTLSDQYGKINPANVYIKDIPKPQQAQLVVRTQCFKNKDVRHLLEMYSKNDSKWTTYTFEVPNPKILNSFNFK